MYTFVAIIQSAEGITVQKLGNAQNIAVAAQSVRSVNNTSVLAIVRQNRMKDVVIALQNAPKFETHGQRKIRKKG